MALCSLCCSLTLLSVVAAASPFGASPYPWSWDTASHTQTWGTSGAVNCTPRGGNTNCSDTMTTLDALITRDIVYVQGYDFGRELQTDVWTNIREEILRIREYKRAKKSEKPYAILGYRGIVVGPPAIWDLPEYSGFWITDAHGLVHKGTWDFRNASARRYYIDDMLSQTNASFADGIFVDTGDAICMRNNLTVRSRQEIYNATARLIGELAVSANAQAPGGKTFWVTVSLKDHLGQDPEGDDGFPLCNATSRPEQACYPYPEEVLYDVINSVGPNVHRQWAPFRQWNIPSRDFGKQTAGCVAAVHTAIGQGQRGSQLMCCNACNQTTTAGLAEFAVSFASFLMGANNGSYFGAGVHFHANTAWDYAWPDLQKPTGAPLGPALQAGNTFVRHFEHVTARVDCSTQTGQIQWHQQIVV